MAEIWYMTPSGKVKNIDSLNNPGCYPGEAGFTAFCFIDTGHIARITAAGMVKIFDLLGLVQSQFALGIASCSGLAMYFEKLVTYDQQQEQFVVFDQQGHIWQFIDTPISGINAWNISGVNLVVRTEFGVFVYRIHARKYYAKLDKGDYLGSNPGQPSVSRLKLPGEVDDPTPPEVLSNGTFADGTTFPTGFTIYGPDDVEAGFSSEVALGGTRAVYFAFPYASWKSINKYGVPVIGGRQYNFSAYTKATANSSGLLGILFRDRNGVGTEVFYTVQYATSYAPREVIVKAPVDLVTVDFRYLAYGSDAQGITYFLNALSLKEDVAPEMTFEHLYNGTFAVYPQATTMPSGWEIGGPGADYATTALEAATMQAQGKAWRITIPAYEDSDWYALQSQPFDIEAGDTLAVSFYFRWEEDTATSIQVSLYYVNEDGSWGDASHKYVSIPAGGGITGTSFDIHNAESVTKARLRIWPKHGTGNWIEACSIVPVTTLNKVVNPDFSRQFAGWSRSGKDALDQTVVDLGASLETNSFRSSLYSCKLEVDGVNCTYAEASPTITLNQSTPKRLYFSAWGAGANVVGSNVHFEVFIRFSDGTTLWNPAGASHLWPLGTYGWTELSFDYLPGKPIQSLDVILDLGRGGTGAAWVDDISVTEDQGAQTVDELAIDVPYTELQSGTLKQFKITAQLKSAGSNVERKGVDVGFEAIPDVGSFEVLATNSFGKASAIYTLPEFSCRVRLKATYGEISASELVTIYPLVVESQQEPEIGSTPGAVDKLHVEIIVPRTPKPLPDVSKLVGRWEVFRPTVYNARQMLDYDLHYSPSTSWEHVRPSVIAALYPKLHLYHYFDDLSDYPNQINWQEIMAQRKEWFCQDAVSYAAPFGDGRYYFNWRNMEAVQWYIDRLIREHGAWSDGIYIDDFWGEAYNTIVDFDWGAEASQLLNYRSVKERLEASARRLRLLREELHRRGKYLTCNFGCARRFNSDGSLTPDTELLAMPFDGFLLEVWLYSWTVNPEDIDSSGFTLEYVKNEIDFVQWCGDHGKWVACLARSSSELYPARMFSLAAFLMGKHKYAYYVHTDWGNWFGTYGSYWHDQLQPELFITTGEPIERYRLSDGLFSRQFENCIALLNMNEQAQTYSLPAGIWYSMRGQAYSGDIQIQRRLGLVLVKERP